MVTALLYIGVSFIALITISAVFRVEDTQGGRVMVLKKPRRFFDRLVILVAHFAVLGYKKMRHSFLRIFFHHVAHRMLKRLYALTHFLEEKTEELLRQNKRTGRRIDAEKRVRSHLDDIAAHQQKTALSKDDIERLRSLE